LLLGSVKLLVTPVSGYTLARLANGICSFGYIFYGYQKSGHLYILRRLSGSHVQSLHGFRGEFIKFSNPRLYSSYITIKRNIYL